jgi:hypothetical protein
MIGTQQVTAFNPQSPPDWHGSCSIPVMSDNTLMTQTPKPVITIETQGEL